MKSPLAKLVEENKTNWATFLTRQLFPNSSFEETPANVLTVTKDSNKRISNAVDSMISIDEFKADIAMERGPNFHHPNKVDSALRKTLDRNSKKTFEAVFAKFEKLAQEHGNVFRNSDKSAKVGPTFTPVEFLGTAVMVFQRPEESVSVLAWRVKQMREELFHEQPYARRIDNSCWTIVMKHVMGNKTIGEKAKGRKAKGNKLDVLMTKVDQAKVVKSKVVETKFVNVKLPKAKMSSAQPTWDQVIQAAGNQDMGEEAIEVANPMAADENNGGVGDGDAMEVLPRSGADADAEDHIEIEDEEMANAEDQDKHQMGNAPVVSYTAEELSLMTELEGADWNTYGDVSVANEDSSDGEKMDEGEDEG